MPDAPSAAKLLKLIEDLRAMMEAGNDNQGTGVTFGELAERFVKSRRDSGVGIKGLDFRLIGLRAFFELWPVELIDEEAWSAYKAARRAATGKGFAVSTLNIELTYARAILALGVDDGLITRNPLRKVAKERGANKRRGVISEEQLQRILSVIEAAWFRAYVLLLADTGFRRNEGLRIRWADVERGYVTVRREDAKSKEARTVKLTERARAAIMAIKDEEFEIGEFVFPGKRRGRETRAQAQTTKLFHDAVEMAGVVLPGGKYPTLHFWRHSWGSRAAMAGVPLPAVQSVLGHANLAATQIYMHPSQDDADGAIDAAERAALEQPRRSPGRAPEKKTEK